MAVTATAVSPRLLEKRNICKKLIREQTAVRIRDRNNMTEQDRGVELPEGKGFRDF